MKTSETDSSIPINFVVYKYDENTNLSNIKNFEMLDTLRKSIQELQNKSKSNKSSITS